MRCVGGCVGFLGCYYLFVTTLQDESEMITKDSRNMRCDVFSRRQLAPILERISYGLGQRYQYFDEISRALLVETTRPPGGPTFH
jgi:hypothetical protein